jgi:hypothetical protein
MKIRDVSGKGVVVIACGAIIAGLIANLSGGMVINSFALHIGAEQINSQVSQNRWEELDVQTNEDKKFLAIEPTLKPNHFTTLWEPSDYAERFTQEANKSFLHQLNPLMPGYNEFVDALERLDENSDKGNIITGRVMDRGEFNSTCDMVTDLNAGLDISKNRGEEQYGGKYFGGAGLTPENFEVLLKGCGDTKLQYLDDLKKEYKIQQAETVEIEEMLNKMTAEEAQP